MSNEAEGMAAQAEADAIIKSLGLDGDGPTNVADVVSRIEADVHDEDTDDTQTDDTETTTDKGDKPQAESLTATGTTGKGEGEGAAAAAAATGEQPAGVLLKDGKHFLPYEKHVEERRMRVEAEQRAKQLEDQLAELRAGKATSDSPAAGDDKGAASAGDLAGDLKMVEELEAKAKAYADEGLEELAANAATQAKVMRSLMTKVEKFGGYVEQFQAREREEKTRQEATVQAQVAEAIENHPTLRYLDDTYEKDPKSAELFERIRAEDAFLKTQPNWQGKPLADRFAAAVKRVELEAGAIPLPTEYQTTTQVKAAAEARTREEGEFRPNTLSDLPGGGLPRSANDDPFDGMDPVQLERLMDDPKKMNEILARVG